MYMREYWVQVHLSPIVYRYVDWSITVPLQMIEFNLILKAAGKPTSSAMFWKLLLGTVIMLAFGYCGVITVLNAWPAFAGGAAGSCSDAVVSSFNNMRMIVTAGWSIYPLGYLFGYLLGAVDETFLNVIYNIADFVNKIAFLLVRRQGRLCRKEGCFVGLKLVMPSSGVLSSLSKKVLNSELLLCLKPVLEDRMCKSRSLSGGRPNFRLF